MPRQASAAAGFATSTARDPDAVEAARRSRPVGARRVRRPHRSPASHFLPADAALLGCLAKDIVLERFAFGELRASGFISSKPATRD